jgi:8-oxo-dGTP pyrophosphatase MutT (NUDIX family)
VRVDVHVAAEGRNKKNEVVLARPDVAAVVLVHKDPQDPGKTLVGLVREFRSAVSTADGYVREPAGGSSFDPEVPIAHVALDEVREETGLVLAPARLRPLGARQVAATLLSHHAHVWVADLTADEVAKLRAEAGVVHGADDCERTWVELWTVDELRRRPVLDWASLGMVLAAVAAAEDGG